MPTEILRKIATKKITLPGGGGTVVVPVITQITFQDTVDRGQESTYTISNYPPAWRDVHVAWVGDKGSADATETPDPDVPTPDDCVAVERVDKWRVKDPVSRGQETFPEFTGNKADWYDKHGPPFFPQHAQTHLVKYINDPDDGNSVISELLDKVNVKDPVERGQQTHYTLANPPSNDGIGGLTLGTDPNDSDYPNIATVQVQQDSGLPDITAVSGSSPPTDPPYRLDPFQNIVQVSGEAEDFLVGGSDFNGQPCLFGSQNGKDWYQVPAPPAASSQYGSEVIQLAYGDGAWLAILSDSILGADGSVTRSYSLFKSTDRCKTWTRIGDGPGGLLSFRYGKPFGGTVSGSSPPQPIKGFFAGFGTSTQVDETGMTQVTYSKDTGATWQNTSDIVSGNDYDMSGVHAGKCFTYIDYTRPQFARPASGQSPPPPPQIPSGSPKGEFFTGATATGSTRSPWPGTEKRIGGFPGGTTYVISTYTFPGYVPDPAPAANKSFDMQNWPGGTFWPGPDFWLLIDVDDDQGGESFGPAIPTAIAKQNDIFVVVGSLFGEDWTAPVSGTGGNGLSFGGPALIEQPETATGQTGDGGVGNEQVATNVFSIFMDLAAGNGMFVWFVSGTNYTPAGDNTFTGENWTGVATSSSGVGWALNRHAVEESGHWVRGLWSKKIKMFCGVNNAIFTAPDDTLVWTKVPNSPFPGGAIKCLALGPIISDPSKAHSP
jgi:hypothetical protein